MKLWFYIYIKNNCYSYNLKNFVGKVEKWATDLRGLWKPLFHFAFVMCELH